MSDLNDNLFQQAVKFAIERHGEQKYGDMPYIVHLYSVARHFEFTDQKVIAILHDILEDTPTTYEELKEKFGNEIAGNVWVLTRDEDTDYRVYIRTIAGYITTYPDALLVKIADLEENIHSAMYQYHEYAPLLPRYRQALALLKSYLE